MRAAIFGFRKVFIFVVAAGAMTFGLHEALVALKVMDAEKATQVATVGGAFFGGMATIFGTLMSAFKGSYRAGQSPYAPPAPPEPHRPPGG